MVKVSSYSSRTITISETINGVDHTFEVTFEPESYSVKISEDGKRAVVGYVCSDDVPLNPRKAYDNVGTMVCWHRSYLLGDEQRRDDASEWFEEIACDADPSLADKLERLDDKNYDGGKEYYATRRRWVNEVIEKNFVLLPLYLYDHSGITMSTGPFSCPWDSGQVGWIYCSRERAIKEWGNKAFTKAVKEKARKCLRGEVEEYDMYLTGDVHGVCREFFVNVAAEGDDPEWESHEREDCWGLFGGKYAKEVLVDCMEYDSVKEFLATPIEDPNQLNLLEEVGA